MNRVGKLGGKIRPLTQIDSIRNEQCRFMSARGGQKVMAIRRETQSVWERRAPLGPQHVRKLVKQGIKVIVQPSNRRAYPMAAYANVGARIQEDMSEASVIFGVKQVPVDALLSNKTYCFFSHTIKAQADNMDLLDAMLEKNIRCIDYEKMNDEKGQRVVAFGKYAGIAGMIDILHGLGLRLLALGHHTPFMHVGPAHNYRNTHHARQGIRDAGYEISLDMMPKSIGPMTFVFTGSGNVSQGAQEIFQELPHEYVAPNMLKKVAMHGDTNKLYATEISRSDQFERRLGGGYNVDEFEEHPERYISTFAHKYAPYASVIVNGIYWSPATPRLITIPDAKALITPAKTPWLATSPGSPSLPSRLVAICDISADPGGSIEFMNECTTIDEPFCLYDADNNKDKKSFKGDGVLICSIDNMPTQLPREATDFFGDLLYPYVSDIMKSDATKPFLDNKDKMGPIVSGAVITSNGKLTPDFEYIADLREANAMKVCGDFSSSKKALVLGAGYVSAPVIEYLTRDSDLGITVASALKSEADTLSSKYERTEPVLLNVQERPDMLDDLMKSHDVVVSLLPWTIHADIAKRCIANKVNMVTASYQSQALKNLHGEAVQAGITAVNECGVDPGIDHFLALECFDAVHTGGGKIESFVSFCGGLPAPECSDNPLGYKFSWSPRGALLNMLSGAKYLQNGNVVEVEENGGLLESVVPMDFLPGFSLEGYPNRDSTIYGELYSINEASTILRGTLRYKGYVDAVKGLVKLGLLDPTPTPVLHENGPELTWKQYMCHLMNQTDSIFYDNLKDVLLDRLESAKMLKVIEDLGLMSDSPIMKAGSPLDTVSHHLSKRLSYEKDERDMILMRHEVTVRWPDGRRELKGINMVHYGDPNGYIAMAKTVGYPCAIATKMVLDGEIQKKGMVLPFTKDIWKPMLQRLRAEGIQDTEKSTFL
ncbi:alpha-aminoadipic semialdehyde synthase, mitochondrial [Eurytemora carolleeae]|uniref:alpha-aminoadipic semialdehyde synthase, mitochondrial n=1 Tax=Eurytemora carolleeae TaxID=1294199 RepID=UPI000C76C95B|nr:alpha-aminoadipic semialdehyde synthase, mitochondrial [Eurytemora carolleeae]|eukprot:XP_023324527.1 alpha-aminoadipic semialdehyde synthase, mitochondrial-like [Eurytemora affinis]